ncbi:hypothetical protein [Kribbella turkmenica]|nr:hypothetical protein [Kribbella turkmenica]
MQHPSSFLAELAPATALTVRTSAGTAGLRVGMFVVPLDAPSAAGALVR